MFGPHKWFKDKWEHNADLGGKQNRPRIGQKAMTDIVVLCGEQYSSLDRLASDYSVSGNGKWTS